MLNQLPAAEIDIYTVRYIDSNDMNDGLVSLSESLQKLRRARKIAEVPGISKGCPSSVSRCVSMVISAELDHSGSVYLLIFPDCRFRGHNE